VKIIPLRQLVRQPLQVKRWTRAGQSVQVTDNGRPLWIVRAAESVEDIAQRQVAIDEVLDETPREPRQRVSAAQLLEDSRR